MAETRTFVANAPVWVDLSSKDAAGSRDYYAKLFGWKVDLTKDPAAGGYALATIGGKNVAGIGPAQDPNAPTAWMIYIGTRDADATAKEVPSYWQVYFGVDDVDKAHKKAVDLGATSMLEPQDFPGGRFAILSDPQGAAFGLLRMER